MFRQPFIHPVCHSRNSLVIFIHPFQLCPINWYLITVAQVVGIAITLNLLIHPYLTPVKGIISNPRVSSFVILVTQSLIVKHLLAVVCHLTGGMKEHAETLLSIFIEKK